jgi:MFS transporter, DHA1 family, tetracycline resistance protein
LLLSYLALCLAVIGSLGAWWSVSVSLIAILITRSALTLFYSAFIVSSQAYVADTSTESARAAGMAALGIGGACGLIFGPASSALLARWDLSAAVAIGAVFAAAGLGLIRWKLAATSAPAKKSIAKPLRLFDQRLRMPMATAFLAMYCVTSAQVNTGFLTQDLFKLSTKEAASLAGICLSSVGIALVLAQLLVRRFELTPKQMVTTGCAIGCLGFLCSPFASSPTTLISLYFVSGFGMGFVFPGFQAMASLAVGSDEQGDAAGVVATAQALGMTIAPMASTTLYSLSPQVPFVMVGAVLLVWAVRMACFKV